MKKFGLLAACTLATGCVAQSDQNQSVVYRNGTVLTMIDDRPVAEAVAIKDGIILAVGSEEEVMQAAAPGSRFVDLGGRTMLPGFVDSHGHAYAIGIQAATANLLPPPDGTAGDIASIQSLLSEWAAQNTRAIERVGWIAGFGYDDSQLSEQRHPTRDDLDAISTDVPVLVIHQSGHIGAVNSRALELAGVTAETPDPKGGVFRRRAGSDEPDGVCEEYAFFYMLSKLVEKFDGNINESLVIEGTRLASSFGYTTVQEGRAMGTSIDAMRRAAEKGELRVDLVAYPDILEVDQIEPSQAYAGRFRVGGAKLTIDGSPQGKTAWLSEPYFIVPEGQDPDYRGYAAITPEVTNEAINKAFANGWQILCHANGDAAIDVFIEAVRKARASNPPVNNRPVLIHGQTMRKDQVAALDELDIFPSLFPMHTFYWGDWHRDSVLGPERADDISPTGWVLERGMMFGSHHDAPVALPDSMRVLSATVTRRSRTGDILGPIHRVTVDQALKAMTIWPAWQHFEESRKGTIEPGKLADFVILSDNPLEVPEDQLDDLLVLETIKEGVTVYTRPDEITLVSPALFGVTAHHHAATATQPNAFPGFRSVCGDGCFGHGLSVMYNAFERAAPQQRRP